MKLKKEYITYDTADESMLVPTADAKFAGLIRGNKTLGAILERLKEIRPEIAIGYVPRANEKPKFM